MGKNDRNKAKQRYLFFALWAMAVFAAMGSVAFAAETFPLQAGTLWETSGCIVTGSVPGPTALVLGGVHGNEPAGALAAEQLCSDKLVKGTLVVVPRVNPLGLNQSVRFLPEIGDMNRVYPPSGQNTPAEKMSAEIIALMEKYQIQMLIDLHEARTFHRIDRTSLGQTLLFADNAISVSRAMDAVDAVNRNIEDTIRKFSLVANPISGSSAHYAGKVLGISAFTVETSSKQTMQERVGQHLAIVRVLLAAGGWLNQ